jgi:hypothetical protein
MLFQKYRKLGTQLYIFDDKDIIAELCRFLEDIRLEILKYFHHSKGADFEIKT